MSDDALRVLRAVDRGARLLVGPDARDATASALRAYRREILRPGVDPASVAAFVMDRVVRTEGRQL